MALTSRLQAFETGMLAEEENFVGLACISRELISKVEAVASLQRVVLDVDSTEIPVYGEQEQSACNRHFLAQYAEAPGNIFPSGRVAEDGPAHLKSAHCAFLAIQDFTFGPITTVKGAPDVQVESKADCMAL